MASIVNKYHLALKLPVPLSFPDYPVPNTDLHYHARFHKADMSDEFKGWLNLRGLNVIAGEYFYTPPGRTLEPHSDSPHIDDVVKLNWMKGGEGSTMDWYELKPGATLKTSTTSIHTQYSYAPRKDLIHVHSATIGTPRLVNVGRIHAVHNGKFPRFVACVVLGDLETKARLRWDKAKKIFEDCVLP
jgi:hypothetical protein